MTTGSLLSLQDSAAAATSTGKVLSISDATTGAGYGVASAMTGLDNTGYAGYFTNTSTGVLNYGLYASTSSASGWAGYFDGAVNVAGNLIVSSCTGCSAAGSNALSAITSATTTNSIDNTNWAQTWKWGTLSTQTALTLCTSSMTSGTLLATSPVRPAAGEPSSASWIGRPVRLTVFQQPDRSAELVMPASEQHIKISGQEINGVDADQQPVSTKSYAVAGR